MTTLGLQTLADSTATDPESHSEATTPSRTHVETAQYVHGPDDTESSASSPYTVQTPSSSRLDPGQHTNHPSDSSIAIDLHEQAWKRLVDRTVPKDELPSLIETIFSGRTTSMVDHLPKSDVQALINTIDEALSSPGLPSRIRKKCIRLLSEMCARHSLLPKSLQIEPCYNPADIPHSRGGFADVWKSKHRDLDVAVKVLRRYTSSDLQKITRGFCKEFVAWKALHHPNVLPLLGVIMSEDRFGMVSEWMTNGDINHFVTKHQDANRFELLGDAARGLIYMHGQGMVHGDLKGANILVDQTGHARLADFGLLTIISDSTTLGSYTQGGTTRWMSPELFDPEIKYHCRTKYSDCYALGMVIYEVLSGHLPFYEYKSWAIFGKVAGGDRPERPQGAEGVWFPDDVWEVLEHCWTPQPGDRPSIEDVLQCLERVSRSWVPPSPRLVVAPPPADSPTWGFSDMITEESVDEIGVSPSPSPEVVRQSEKSDLGASAEIVETAPPNNPGERPSLHVNNSLPLQGPLMEAIGGDDMGPRRLREEQNTKSEPVTSPKQPDTRNGSPLGPGSRRTVSETGTWKQRLRKTLPRITSLFQSLQDSEQEVESRVNRMDNRLNNHALSDRERRKLFNELCKTCSRHRVIPESMNIPDCSKDSVEVVGGGRSSVSRGTYRGRQVAIKVVRLGIASDPDIILSRFCREAVTWKHLRHPNILPLVGVTVNNYRFAMVSEWMENGNINEFVREDPRANRIALLVDVANGLKYIHDLRIVHGDPKGTNVLINRDRRAFIADFGLATITGVVTHAAVDASQASLISNDTLMSFTAGGTYRWMSPELLDPERFGIPLSEDCRPTRQSDCYALGMLIYEVLCGHHPYHEIHSDALVMNAITEGDRPEKPEGAKRLGFSDELWKAVERCWLEDRSKRPRVEEILSCLNGAAGFWYMKGF